MVGKSREKIEFNINDPRPGSAKTFSITTEPPTKYPRLTPRIDTVGMMALRKTCLRKSAVPPLPFDRAVAMYSDPSTLIVEDLKLRMIVGDSEIASVSAG